MLAEGRRLVKRWLDYLSPPQIGRPAARKGDGATLGWPSGLLLRRSGHAAGEGGALLAFDVLAAFFLAVDA